MPRTQKVKPVTFFRDSLTGDMLASDTDIIFNVRVSRTVEDGNGNNHYVHCELTLGRSSFQELILSKVEPKQIKWIEWLPPTAEEKEKNKYHKGTNVYFDGVV